MRYCHFPSTLQYEQMWPGPWHPVWIFGFMFQLQTSFNSHWYRQQGPISRRKTLRPWPGTKSKTDMLQPGRDAVCWESFMLDRSHHAPRSHCGHFQYVSLYSLRLLLYKMTSVCSPPARIPDGEAGVQWACCLLSAASPVTLHPSFQPNWGTSVPSRARENETTDGLVGVPALDSALLGRPMALFWVFIFCSFVCLFLWTLLLCWFCGVSTWPD